MTRLTTIAKRRDFLAAANGAKIVTGSLILQMTRRPADHPIQETPRIGYTVTKKMGNAVARNRIKRRLREAAKQSAVMEPGCDYVVISRPRALTCDFSEIRRDMEFAFSRINVKKNSPKN